MANVYDIGAAAERLKNDDTFKDVINKIEKDQVSVFLDADSKPEAREEAHAIVRALGKIKGKIDAMIADMTFETHKDQHRGND